MKATRIALACAACFLLAGAAAFAQEAWEKSGEMMYQHAWFLETSERNYQGAIEVYRKLIATFPDDKKYCALAQLEIGACLEKLGKKDEARAAWEKVVKDYPDQKDAVNDANARLRGQPPAPKKSVEDFKKEMDGAFLQGFQMGRPQPWGIAMQFAAAYPEEAAEYFHSKLVELGKTSGPELAKMTIDPSNLPKFFNAAQASVQMLASCDSDKTRDFMLDLLKRSAQADGQFLGKETDLAVIYSLGRLLPKYVNDEVVNIIIGRIKDADINATPPHPMGIYLAENFFPGNSLVINGLYELAAFSRVNAMALKYMMSVAENAKDEQRAQPAIAFLYLSRKAEVADLYTKIATGKYPEEMRRLAIASLGALAMPDFVPAPQAMAGVPTGHERWHELPAMGGQSTWYPFRVEFAPTDQVRPYKPFFPDKALTDACIKGLKAAYDANNGVHLRQEVVLATEYLGRSAAKPLLIEYAKNALDPQVREIAVYVLKYIFCGFEKDDDVVAAINAIIKDDSVMGVRIQAAWPSPPVTGIAGDEAAEKRMVALLLDALNGHLAANPGGGGNIALFISYADSVNTLVRRILYDTPVHDFQKEPGKIAAALDGINKWWQANKDKSPSDWALAALDSWVKTAREKLAKDPQWKGQDTPWVFGNSVWNLISEALDGVPLMQEVPSPERIQAFCDWYDKNKDRITWNNEKHCFELKGQ